MFVLDISDKAHPKPICQWDNSPPYTGFTHTVLPMFNRNLLIVTDESTSDNASDWPKLVWILDARDEMHPVPISTCPMPPVDAYRSRGGRFGAHNIHENTPSRYAWHYPGYRFGGVMLELFPSPTAGPFGRRLKRERGARAPVTVVTGFLGAGKTTLVRHFLALPEGACTAVIVNEFGESGIDDALLRSSSDNVALLGNGCLCCNVRSDLQMTLRRLIADRERGVVPHFAL